RQPVARPVVQLVVERGQRARQEARVPLVRGWYPRLSPEVRRRRGRRVRRVRADLMGERVGASKPAADRAGPREKPQRIADELRRLIVSGELGDGESLGHEPDLIERFGVSRPSLREALRILEAEGLITVVRGVNGGVVANRPDERLTARTAALVLQSRN